MEEEVPLFGPTWPALRHAPILESPHSSFGLVAHHWVVRGALAAFAVDRLCFVRHRFLHLAPCLQSSVHSVIPSDDPTLPFGGPFSVEQ